MMSSAMGLLKWVGLDCMSWFSENKSHAAEDYVFPYLVRVFPNDAKEIQKVILTKFKGISFNNQPL